MMSQVLNCRISISKPAQNAVEITWYPLLQTTQSPSELRSPPPPPMHAWQFGLPPVQNQYQEEMVLMKDDEHGVTHPVVLKYPLVHSDSMT